MYTAYMKMPLIYMQGQFHIIIRKNFKDFFNFVHYLVKCMGWLVNIENCGILGELEISVLVNKVKMMSYV